MRIAADQVGSDACGALGSEHAHAGDLELYKLAAGFGLGERAPARK